MKEKNTSDLLSLTAQERLFLHSLETRKFWSKKDQTPGDSPLTHPDREVSAIPNVWTMTEGITFYNWQEDCINRWLKEKRGTVKVVTGAGKTILALGIIEKLQALDQELRVAIVVPTIVLQNQWYKEILNHSNLPASAIGKLGGNNDDSFAGDVRILLCVLKSASDKLPALVNRNQVGHKLLLVVDECHHAGAPTMSKVFDTERAYSLGLSATPEREDYLEDTTYDDNQQYDLSLLGRELGPIIYEITVYQGYEQGILPEFEVHHYGLPLSSKEREKYESLSRRLRDVTSELKEIGHQHGIHDLDIARRSQVLAKREDQLGLVARQYVTLVTERKHFLYNAEARSQAVIQILKEEFHKESDTRALLFHESIESVMLLYYKLLQNGYPVTVEHSMLLDRLREESIELFRQGIARIIVSARSLIEGFNVPETDIGIIVASSTSVRQRIQTIGRLLRKGKDINKIATIYVLYIHDTVDEIIYGKTDWDELLGAKRNRYFLWDNKEGLIEQEQAPRAPLPKEEEIPLEVLAKGCEYPGAYEGIEYSCDSDGNVYSANRDLVLNPQQIPEAIRKIKGSYGKFRVTRTRRYILVIVYEQDEWIVKYVGQLATPFKLRNQLDSKKILSELDVNNLQRGDFFPYELVGAKHEIIYFKQRRGLNVLAKKEGRGERFARIGELATDRTKGEDAAGLLQACKDYKAIYPQLSKLIITESQHVVVLRDSKYYYLYTFTAGLEFS